MVGVRVLLPDVASSCVKTNTSLQILLSSLGYSRKSPNPLTDGILEILAGRGEGEQGFWKSVQEGRRRLDLKIILGSFSTITSIFQIFEFEELL